MRLSKRECYNAIKQLIRRGDDLDITYDDFYDQYPLIYATIWRYTDSVELLLDHDANPNVKNDSDLTALFFSAQYGYLDITRLLLEHGANPNSQNIMGHNPLFYAEFAKSEGYYKDNAKIIDLLKEYMNRKNKYTKSRQRLSLMKGLEDRNSLFGNMTFEPGILELISEHASLMKPDHRMQERMLLENRHDEPEPEPEPEPEIDPFTDESEVDNWTECHDCGKSLYLGKYSDYVGEEYFPTLIDEKWYCSDCTEERKKLSKKKGGFRKKTFRRRYRL